VATKTDSKTEYVEKCLDAWAEWNRGGHTTLGYPGSTPIARLMREGPGAGQASGNCTLEMPEEVQRVEQAVRALPEQEKQAIKLKYLKIYKRDKDRAKIMKISRAQFCIILDRARWFIRGRLW